MSDSYDLNKLGPDAFEHLVNHLAIKVLGAGHTGFGPGADAGRDGLFEGEAPYPSTSERWSGTWYIQSKFHKPNPSENAHKWLIGQVKRELDEFQRHDSKRRWPDIWILATNIDPSGYPETGAFDQARKLVSKARQKLSKRFHIWGGRKILDLLASYPDIAGYYMHFLTPGQLLTKFYQELSDAHAEVDVIVRHLAVTQLQEQQYTRLEQAGSAADTRPGIHRLFTDLPFACREQRAEGMAAQWLTRTAAQNLRINEYPVTPEWRAWRQHPSRARTWFVKGGPGQGKSTLAQYFCQIQRAALILDRKGPHVTSAQKALAREIQKSAAQSGLWPAVPRIPIAVELKDYAQWFGQHEHSAHGVLTYLAERLTKRVEQTVQVGTLRRAFRSGSWLFVFDGLDEVPSDVKELVAAQVCHFIDDVLVECRADALTVCTSRPQGYAGQFAELEAPVVELSTLSSEQALACAKPLLQIERSAEEVEASFQALKAAIASPSVREIMTTPLQAHIMAVVVRDGGKPPERRWQLFNNFYHVIKRREANRDLPDKKLAKLLREGDLLLKALHNALGFELHARAETSDGAQTSLKRVEFRKLVHDTVSKLQDSEIEETVHTLMEATTERLVLVTTPESGEQVRFDIRPLQEFFAAEYFYELVEADRLASRLEIVGADAHWREVMHFVLSALIENKRQTELAVALNSLARLSEDAEGGSRTFRRRMAGGSLLAARLLQEGVLEQNKVHRQQCRGVLEPLFGNTDDYAVRLLRDVAQPHSKGWLQGILVDALNELAEPENIGAALSLSYGLVDRDPLVHRVIGALLNASPGYRSCLFQKVYARRGENRVAPEWFVEVALTSLMRPDWQALGRAGIRAAFGIVGAHPRKVQSEIAGLGLSPEVANVYKEAFRSEPHESTRSEVDRRSRGVVEEVVYRAQSSFGMGAWASSVWSALAESPGVMHTVYLILKLAHDRTPAALENLLDAVRDDLAVLSVFPRPTMELLPFIPNQYSSEPRRLREELCSEDQLRGRFENGRGGLVSQFRISPPPQKKEAEAWQKTIDEFPSLALHFFLDESFVITRNQKHRYIDSPEGARLLANKALDEPRLLLDYAAAWGKFITLCPDLEDKLKSALVEVCKRFAPSESPVGGIRAFPFAVRLPSEAPLLPHVWNSLVNAPLHHRGLIGDSWFLPAKGQDSIEGRVKQLCKVDALRQVMRESSSTEEEAAAAMLLLIHPDRDPSDVTECQEVFVSHYQPGIHNWYLKGVAAALLFGVSANEATTCSVLDKLLQKARTDYEGRMALDPVLESWRQTSNAPVQKSRAAGSWA